MLCDYGCGQEAYYQLSNGKYCCCKSSNSCPNIRNKNKIKHKEIKYKECPICHNLIPYNIGGQYTIHLRCCKRISEFNKHKRLLNFDNSKYIKWYNNIIEKRMNNPILKGYKEKHHILPKSLGGSNNKSNLIYLTAKEHYICHMLLVEIYRKDEESYKKMLAAFILMKTRDKKYVNISSRLYEKYKTEYSNILKNSYLGENNGVYRNKWMSNKELKLNKLVSSIEFNEYISKGWVFGRDVWNKEEKVKIKKERIKYIKQKKKINVEDNISKYTKYYEIYKEYGWEEFRRITNYKQTQCNLVQQLKRYVKDFVPQNGKKR